MHYVTNEQSAAVKILAIAGSLREQSYNRSLLEAVRELAPSWVEVSIYESLDEVPLFNEDVADSATPAGVLKLRHAFSEADGVLIGTPEYNQAVPGVVKNMTNLTAQGVEVSGVQADCQEAVPVRLQVFGRLHGYMGAPHGVVCVQEQHCACGKGSGVGKECL